MELFVCAERPFSFIWICGNILPSRTPIPTQEIADTSVRIVAMKGPPGLSEMIQNFPNFGVEAIKCFLSGFGPNFLPIPVLVGATSPASASLPALIRGPSDTRAHDCWLSKKSMSDIRFGDDLCELELSAAFGNC
jgi:hypothetical protein